ncbi:leucyl aminopeptidase [Motilibacter peucedani]|uniref:Probable cytosol aminopeptidase n=1 Tax=Motilibacter peucedani TaxID=598650 RepID=A0A420XP97_9ACTN|nr:leucyl aminopeptidase [Motilibacter peucedani]RKS74018.1 leucyl aminopeptidase [Motilibacter peucedani]
MPELTLTTSAAAGLRVDALVVGVHEGQRGGPVLADGGLEAAVASRLAKVATALGATGAREQVVRLPGGDGVAAPLVLAVGLGPLPGRRRRELGLEAEVLRRAAGAAVRALAGSARVAIALPAPDSAAVAAVCEGALLGSYAFTRYRRASSDAQQAPVASVTVVSPVAREAAARAAADRARALGASVALVRDLVNTPPSDLPPRALAEAARTAVEGLPVEVEVLDEKVLRRRGFGGITGVGQGSANPPRLVRLSYTGGGPDAPHLALVGKGITFDSGGLSLKPPASMITMKCDMGGAAAVLGAVLAIARLGLPLRVTGWMPLAENMPSGSAIRPSDVLTIYGGRTVEVLNTDAEGRLVLADAIVAACEEQPDVLLDTATLTGAQLVALGSRTGAVMGNNDDLRAAVVEAADSAGEAMWPMPLPDELRKSMDSAVADIANMGDRYGGMLVAGLFLREFVADGVPWAHLDIAGPAFNEGDPYGYTPKGGTGASVRTLVAVAERLAQGQLPR